MFCGLWLWSLALVFGFVLRSWYFVVCSSSGFSFLNLESGIWNLKFEFALCLLPTAPAVCLLLLPTAVCLLLDRRHFRPSRLPATIAPDKLIDKVKDNLLIFHL